MRKEKLAWFEGTGNGVDLMLRAHGSECDDGKDATLAACFGYSIVLPRDYIFFADTKGGNYTTIKHNTYGWKPKCVKKS